MSPENTEKLFSAFPRLFRGRDKSPDESSMSWGFQCEDGWFRLIWDLSLGIEKIAWKEGLHPDHENWPEATQVKQKFGELRFGLRNDSVAMKELITSAQQTSNGICELCGEPGSVVSNNRRSVKSLCLKHGREYLYSNEDASRIPVWEMEKK